jgi:hypothetical protein
MKEKAIKSAAQAAQLAPEQLPLLREEILRFRVHLCSANMEYLSKIKSEVSADKRLKCIFLIQQISS